MQYSADIIGCSQALSALKALKTLSLSAFLRAIKYSVILGYLYFTNAFILTSLQWIYWSYFA